MKNKMPLLLSVFSLPFLALGLQGCGESEARPPAAKSEKPPLEVISLQTGRISGGLQIPGELVAYQQVDLYAKVNSFVKKLYADVGSQVKAGQLLAVMEAPEVNAQLSGAESRLKSQEALYLASKATYDRLLETSKTPGTVSRNDLDLAYAKQKSDLAQLDAARAAHREVNDTRNYLEIRAPFAGIITARNVSSGAYVGPSGKGSDLPIFTLQEQEHLRLVVSVPEAYTPYISQESEFSFKVKSLPGDTFNAKVARLAGALDSRLRSQRTEMDVHNTSKKLLPGMIAEVSVPLKGNASNFVLPASAVLNAPKGIFVLRVSNNKVNWVPVQTGRSDGNNTEVFGGLQANDVLVKNASEEIRDGSDAGKLKVSQPETAEK